MDRLTTGATLIGGVSLQPAVAGVLDDVAGWAGFDIHSGFWATLILAAAGAFIHMRTPRPAGN